MVNVQNNQIAAFFKRYLPSDIYTQLNAITTRKFISGSEEQIIDDMFILMVYLKDNVAKDDWPRFKQLRNTKILYTSRIKSILDTVYASTSLSVEAGETGANCTKDFRFHNELNYSNTSNVFFSLCDIPDDVATSTAGVSSPLGNDNSASRGFFDSNGDSASLGLSHSNGDSASLGLLSHNNGDSDADSIHRLYSSSSTTSGHLTCSHLPYYDNFGTGPSTHDGYTAVSPLPMFSEQPSAGPSDSMNYYGTDATAFISTYSLYATDAARVSEKSMGLDCGEESSKVSHKEILKSKTNYWDGSAGVSGFNTLSHVPKPVSDIDNKENEDYSFNQGFLFELYRPITTNESSFTNTTNVTSNTTNTSDTIHNTNNSTTITANNSDTIHTAPTNINKAIANIVGRKVDMLRVNPRNIELSISEFKPDNEPTILMKQESKSMRLNKCLLNTLEWMGMEFEDDDSFRLLCMDWGGYAGKMYELHQFDNAHVTTPYADLLLPQDLDDIGTEGFKSTIKAFYSDTGWTDNRLYIGAILPDLLL